MINKIQGKQIDDATIDQQQLSIDYASIINLSSVTNVQWVQSYVDEISKELYNDQLNMGMNASVIS